MKTEIIYFSATNTTRMIVKEIAKGLSGEVQFTDITLPENRKRYRKVDSCLTIIATPVYGERIPRIVLDFMKQIHGNGKPLVAVCVYGNMGVGITLKQFEDFAAKHDFCLIAAGTFIGQHTYATKKAPIAYGRPNERDLKRAVIFGKKIQKKLDLKKDNPIVIPKTVLPKAIAGFPDSGIRLLVCQPRIKKGICNGCGVCARKCPVGAIDPNTLEIEEQKCLRCYSCVKVCPQNARVSKFRTPVFERVFHAIGRNAKDIKIIL